MHSIGRTALYHVVSEQQIAKINKLLEAVDVIKISPPEFFIQMDIR